MDRSEKVPGGWALVESPSGDQKLEFQREEPFVPPVWPTVAGQQQMGMHLDIAVDNLGDGPDRRTRFFETALLRPQFDMRRFNWPDSPAVEFHISHGEMIRLLRANAFEVLDLVELRPGPDAVSRFPYVSVEWARRWPSEEVW